MIGAVAPAEAVETPAPLLEEIDDGRQIGKSLDAVARLPAPARARPARVALLAIGAERDHVGAPLRAAARAERNVERKQDFVERSHEPPQAHEGANLIQNNAQPRVRTRLRQQSEGGDQACRMSRTS